MITQSVPLAPHTTLQVGGNADHFTSVHTIAELKEAIDFAATENLPVRVLGGGSNLLVPDDGVRGLVIKIELTGTEVIEQDDDVLVTVAAGESLDSFIETTVANGWWGLENLSHIPGTVGATPVQNVGAYGVEVKDVIEAVTVYDTSAGEERQLSPSTCQFGYRDSVFKHEAGADLIVTSVTFSLSKTPKPQLQYKDLAQTFGDAEPTQQEIREAVIAIRSKKFPDWHTVGTAGSFFKNPIIPESHFLKLKEQYADLPGFGVADGLVKVPLGWILDRICNYKGIQDGHVGTYAGQALVLINHGGASATEIETFAEKVVASVQEKTDITIEWEVTRW